MKCLVCGDPIQPGNLVGCGSCDTPHHRDCFEYNGHCAVYACGSKTYVLKVLITGGATAADVFSTNIPVGQTAAVAAGTVVAAAALSPTPTFVWSDESVLGHGAATADWIGDWLVRNLPTDSQTLTKS